MGHAHALRVIGQSLEVAKVCVFEIRAAEENYTVKTTFLNKAGEWILRYAFGVDGASEDISRDSTISRAVRFSPTDIARLDEQARKQRKTTAANKPAHARLSLAMRSVGDYLDGIEVGAFSISWNYDCVSLDYRLPNAQSETRTFTTEKLEQLAARSRFRRLSRTRFSYRWPGAPRSD